MPMQTHGPGTSSGGQASSEPTWTTGQGIGFLAAFFGWILAAFGLVSGMISGYLEADGLIVAILGSLTAVGVIAAIPGTIVFHRCKRPEE